MAVESAHAVRVGGFPTPYFMCTPYDLNCSVGKRWVGGDFPVPSGRVWAVGYLASQRQAGPRPKQAGRQGAGHNAVSTPPACALTGA